MFLKVVYDTEFAMLTRTLVQFILMYRCSQFLHFEYVFHQT